MLVAAAAPHRPSRTCAQSACVCVSIGASVGPSTRLIDNEVLFPPDIAADARQAGASASIDEMLALCMRRSGPQM